MHKLVVFRNFQNQQNHVSRPYYKKAKIGGGVAAAPLEAFVPESLSQIPPRIRLKSFSSSPDLPTFAIFRTSVSARARKAS